ncbi:SpoIIIAH-like family protein [Paenibacillus motobuensis]|uniref:SpoIIIAH-like family protein n=1 Tax=Paenibacillus TaxID=44249 RepID=UPI00203E8429|nr:MULTISPECIES: SpoIIIAH-like family protein [Paenibacillus]MCM3040248.1 SpoIIIAH-like family protein [Paenibacillus lutimineralis]MCM3647352.1 SpoIIIAH-like family protein [Paenibacillus motobuensis]
MKSKRQTIWLVSMLSLMVILSAYYLFTEDSSTKGKNTDGQIATMDQNGGSLNGLNSLNSQDDMVINEVDAGKTQDDGLVTDDSAAGVSADEGTKDGAAADDKKPAGQDKDDKGKKPDKAGDKSTKDSSVTESTSDEDVLKQLESQGVSGLDNLTSYQAERSNNNNKKYDELMRAMNDESKTLEEAAMAQKELSALEEKEDRIYDIEEKLQQQYSNAIVKESGDNYQVLVVSEKLEAKDAVSIMDLVIKELGVSQDKVSVQYVTQ